MELLVEPKIAVVAGSRKEFEWWVMNHIIYIDNIDSIRGRDFDLVVEVGTFYKRPFRFRDELLMWLRRAVKSNGR